MIYSLNLAAFLTMRGHQSTMIGTDVEGKQFFLFLSSVHVSNDIADYRNTTTTVNLAEYLAAYRAVRLSIANNRGGV